MSQRQIESLNLMQMPLAELQEKILREAESNPVLEIESPPEEILPPPGTTAPDGALPGSESSAGSGDDDADLFAEVYSDDGSYMDELPLPEERENPDVTSSREYHLNSLARGETLHEHLFSELSCSGADGEIAAAAAELVGGIDNSGYLQTHPADVAQMLGVSLETVEEALKLLQSFGPPGVGARSAGECLLLQLEAQGRADDTMRRLLTEFGPDLEANRLPKVAKALMLSMEELRERLDRLKHLNPYPGRIFAGSETDYVSPDMEVVEENGVFVLKMEERALPRVRLSQYYTSMLKSSDLSPEDRAYLQEKTAAARELVKALELRKSTLRRVGEVLLETQHEFWSEGVSALRPLTMREVAVRIDAHETTVSRATANKYLLCRQGFFELKYFFTNGFVSEDGESVSRRAIYEKIRELVEHEDGAKPLSDDRISQLLSEAGFSVSRRTVAKYRGILGIAPTPLRRKF